MNWYSGIIKFAKFINNKSALCEHCMKPLIARGVSVNKRHMYPVGTNYICTCGKSNVWANSIRNAEDFVAEAEGTPNHIYGYYQGFCNDKFCGICLSTLTMIENGVKVRGEWQERDRMGCLRCPGNQHIAMDLYAENKENDINFLMEWYKSNVGRIKTLIGYKEKANAK